MKIFIVTGSTDDGQVVDTLCAFTSMQEAVNYVRDEQENAGDYAYDDYDIEETTLVMNQDLQ